ncbi:hypothetical protein EV363DRAFT_1421758 [Boletus edulis]|nr:hypothetical protein EV363DRAFT_1421758 [Boletus edulis]
MYVILAHDAGSKLSWSMPIFILSYVLVTRTSTTVPVNGSSGYYSSVLNVEPRDIIHITLKRIDASHQDVLVPRRDRVFPSKSPLNVEHRDSRIQLSDRAPTTM